MKVAVVAYPILDEDDLRWISSFRRRHDPQASRIGVHFTLVFPVEASPSDVSSEIADVAKSTGPIRFAIRRSEIMRDAFGNGSHVFLVPDEGATEIATLHDCLYAGVLRPHLRSDIAFVPHMTIGAAPDSSGAERAADELDVPARVVRGRIEQLALVDVSLPIVQTLATYPLGDAVEPNRSTATTGRAPE
jgi:2'-5' RNA ligase